MSYLKENSIFNHINVILDQRFSIDMEKMLNDGDELTTEQELDLMIEIHKTLRGDLCKTEYFTHNVVVKDKRFSEGKRTDRLCFEMDMYDGIKSYSDKTLYLNMMMKLEQYIEHLENKMEDK